VDTQFLKQAWDEIEQKKPLIHFITNYVTVNDCANVVLACGARPVMADAIDEVIEMTEDARALVLNTGTLNRRIVESMMAAGKTANERKIPVVLDPVGVGATAFRKSMVRELLEAVHPSVIRGNQSEIAYLGLENGTQSGVDSAPASSLAAKIEDAKTCAQRYHCCVVSSGKEDVITDGNRVILCSNGNEMMARVTGTGCMGTALLGALCGTSGQGTFEEAAAAAAAIGIAGEMAADQEGEAGLGHFHMGIIDAVSHLTGSMLLEKAKLHEEL
jgi:hydroxyethylthiazole kinase